MSDNIYNQQIKAQAASLSESKPLVAFNAKATVDNPLCGDRITVALAVSSERCHAVHFSVKGCLLCKASAATLEQLAVGCDQKSITAAHEIFKRALTTAFDLSDLTDSWQRFTMFAPVTAHKSRHSCVLLGFEALEKAFQTAALSPQSYNE